MTEQYALGLDGGGTKTAAELCGPDGRVLARAEFGGLNRNSAAAEQTGKSLRELFGWLRGRGPLENCRAVCMGCAGVSNPEARGFLTGQVRAQGYEGPLKLVTDSEVALYGALGGPVGAVLISGTGSICFGRNPAGETRRAGGWGHRIDDEGSGYALGRDVLSAVVRAEDGRGPATALSGLVFERLGARDMGALIRFVYDDRTGKREIASFAPLLDRALEAGDAAAEDILKKAAENLCALAVPVVEGLGLEQRELALAGSILTHSAPVRQAVRAGLSERFPALSLAAARDSAAAGAARMALELWKGEEKNA